MKVIVNKPAPAVTPPTTYDIVGLTATQAHVIRDILGDQWAPDNHITHPVYVALQAVFPARRRASSYYSPSRPPEDRGTVWPKPPNFRFTDFDL